MHKIKNQEEIRQIEKFRPKITDSAYHHTDKYIHTHTDREKKRYKRRKLHCCPQLTPPIVQIYWNANVYFPLQHISTHPHTNTHKHMHHFNYYILNLNNSQKTSKRMKRRKYCKL